MTVFVYDAAGNLAAEYPSQAPSTNCTTCYVTTDHLVSTRVVTDVNGCAVFRQDYLPFGEEILTSTGNPRYSATGGTICTTNGYLSPSPIRDQFTAKELDPESGLYHFPARYFSGAQGRFTSPDEPFTFADPDNPQSWNLYSYVRNSPLVNVDPWGRDCVYTHGATQSDTSIAVGIESGNCSSSAGAYVAGTIDRSSLALNNGTISYSYSPYSGADLGTGTIGLPANEFPGIQGQANNFGSQQIASAGPVVNALGVGALSIVGGLELSGAFAGAGSAELGFKLLSSQARNIQTIDTIIADHVTMSDLAGGAKEAAGFEVRTGSKVWNHIQELKDARAGLARAIKNLEGSLGDPAHGSATRQIVQQAIQKGQTAIRMIDAALR